VIRFLPETFVVALHDDQIRLYGGSYGIRDTAMLNSAMHTPCRQFEGKYRHPTIFEMAAAYGFHLCQNHPFIDGNKRTAGMAMLTFLKLNGLRPVATELDYYRVMMAVASGAMGKKELAIWLQTAVEGIPPSINDK
jgi:death-on-curing protein